MCIFRWVCSPTLVKHQQSIFCKLLELGRLVRLMDEDWGEFGGRVVSWRVVVPYWQSMHDTHPLSFICIEAIYIIQTKQSKLNDIDGPSCCCVCKPSSSSSWLCASCLILCVSIIVGVMECTVAVFTARAF